MEPLPRIKKCVVLALLFASSSAVNLNRHSQSELEHLANKLSNTFLRTPEVVVTSRPVYYHHEECHDCDTAHKVLQVKHATEDII